MLAGLQSDSRTTGRDHRQIRTLANLMRKDYHFSIICDFPKAALAITRRAHHHDDDVWPEDHYKEAGICDQGQYGDCVGSEKESS